MRPLIDIFLHGMCNSSGLGVVCCLVTSLRLALSANWQKFNRDFKVSKYTPNFEHLLHLSTSVVMLSFGTLMEKARFELIYYLSIL